MSMKRLRKRSCCLFLIVLMIFTQIPFTANAAIYPDTANHWACSYIDFVTNKFIMTSPDGTYFYPSEPLTRIDAVKAAAKLVGVTVNRTNASDYLDIQGHPEYAGYVNWADDIGIIDEYSRDIFGPEFEIDRETFCTMLYRLYNAYDYPLLYKRSYVSFNDQSSISSWATEAINRLYCAEVINGGDTGNFEPKRDITRAEAAVALRNIYFEIRDATLTAVEATDTNHEAHNAYFSVVRTRLIGMGYSSSKIYTKNYVTKEYFLDALIRSKIFVYKGHADTFRIELSDGSVFSASADIGGLPANALAQCNLIVWQGCNTAGFGGTAYPSSIAGKSYTYGGAQHVVGFVEEIDCYQSRSWLEVFFQTLMRGYSIHQACLDANAEVARMFQFDKSRIDSSSYVVYGNKYDILSP